MVLVAVIVDVVIGTLRTNSSDISTWMWDHPLRPRLFIPKFKFIDQALPMPGFHPLTLHSLPRVTEGS